MIYLMYIDICYIRFNQNLDSMLMKEPKQWDKLLKNVETQPSKFHVALRQTLTPVDGVFHYNECIQLPWHRSLFFSKCIHKNI